MEQGLPSERWGVRGASAPRLKIWRARCVGPELFGGPIQGLYDWNDQNGPATGIQSRFTSIDVVGTVANVRLDTDNWTGHRFTDFFNLVKFDGQWKVVSKVFYLHP